MFFRPNPVRFETSMAILPETSVLRREPRGPRRPRPVEFLNAFEDRILYYDCFRYPYNDQILLIGPPPHNLASALQETEFVALPSGRKLHARMYPSRSTMITSLDGAPSDTATIGFDLGGHQYHLNVQPDSSAAFAGRRLLFTINKNNKLDWIRSWAEWHVRKHGAQAVLLFDNGSTDYGIGDIERVFSGIAGLETFSVISLPYKFGPLDHWILTHRFWPRFLQISATSIALRRFGMKAEGIVNCDIDELMWGKGRSVYDLVNESSLGAMRVPGRWIEASYEGAAPTDHYGYQYRIKGIGARLSPPKCIIAPGREWVRDFKVHPYLHRVHGAPGGHRTLARNAMFWHFRGINTNWKEDRTAARQITSCYVIDQDWVEASGTE